MRLPASLFAYDFLESNIEARALWISVYVDGKRYEVRDKRSLQGGVEKEDDSVFSVRTRYMNNKDVSIQKIYRLRIPKRISMKLRGQNILREIL